MENVYAENAVMSLKDWIISVVITVIPVVGFIMLLVWSFSDSINPNKKNWARATLIVFAAVFILYFLAVTLFMGAIVSNGGLESLDQM